jgi:tetratricopeptide (TPR) repeat protein
MLRVVIGIFVLIFPSLLSAQENASRFFNPELFNVKPSQTITSYESKDFKKVNPEDVDGFLNRGIEKMKKQLFDDAIEDFDEVIKIYSKSSDSYYYKGICFKYLNKLKEARACIEKSIELSPNFFGAYNELGGLCLMEKNIKDAKRHFQTAKDLNPKSPISYFNLANVALRELNTPKAAGYLKESVQKDSSYAESYILLGVIRYYENRRKAAKDYFDKAIKYNPNLSDPYLWRGFLYILKETTKVR